jgi:hypothetical protein
MCSIPHAVAVSMHCGASAYGTACCRLCHACRNILGRSGGTLQAQAPGPAVRQEKVRALRIAAVPTESPQETRSVLAHHAADEHAARKSLQRDTRPELDGILPIPEYEQPGWVGGVVEGLASIGENDHDLATPIDREGKPTHVARGPSIVGGPEAGRAIRLAIERHFPCSRPARPDRLATRLHGRRHATCRERQHGEPLSSGVLPDSQRMVRRLSRGR